MKKLSVIVLALVLVVSLASVSFAATTTYGGEVAVQLSNGVTSTAVQTANFVIDYTKTYNDQLSAGLTLKHLRDSVTPGNDVLLAIDTTGWIKFNYSPMVITVKTSAGGNAADALGVLYDMGSGAGAQIDYTVMEGATVTVVGNAPAVGTMNYMAKAVYNANGLKVGAGYQDGANQGFAAFGSLALGPVTVGGEYAGRLAADTTGIRGTVAATFGPITVNGKFQNQSAGFTNFDGDPDAYTAFDIFQDNGTEGNAIATDATFKATDALSVYGNFQMVLGTDGDMSYKGGATYALSESLKADASYKAINSATDKSAVNVTITDTLTAGLVATLSLDYDIAGKASSYTAKIDATL